MDNIILFFMNLKENPTTIIHT